MTEKNTSFFSNLSFSYYSENRIIAICLPHLVDSRSLARIGTDGESGGRLAGRWSNAITDWIGYAMTEAVCWHVAQINWLELRITAFTSRHLGH